MGIFDQPDLLLDWCLLTWSCNESGIEVIQNCAHIGPDVPLWLASKVLQSSAGARAFNAKSKHVQFGPKWGGDTVEPYVHPWLARLVVCVPRTQITVRVGGIICRGQQSKTIRARNSTMIRLYSWATSFIINLWHDRYIHQYQLVSSMQSQPCVTTNGKSKIAQNLVFLVFAVF